MRRNIVLSPTSPSVPHIMTLRPAAGGSLRIDGRRNENRQDLPATAGPLTMTEDRIIKTEPTTPLVGVDRRVPLSDHGVRNHTEATPAAPSEPRLAVNQTAEAGHQLAKAAYNSRAERRKSCRHVNRLKEQADTIQLLNARIRVLEKSERRLKSRVGEDKESLKDSKAALQAAQYQASILEEDLDNRFRAQKETEAMLDRYRAWWLNEYYCLKVALALIHDPDDGVRAMQESSRARYRVHLASQSD